MFLENQSKFGFDETVQKIQNEFEGKTWKVSAVHDLQQTLRNSGKEVLPVKVFAVCHPKHSGRILERNDERIVSCMMPCRVSVYEKADGKTYVSRINVEPMAQAMSGFVGDVMAATGNEIETIIADLIIQG